MMGSARASIRSIVVTIAVPATLVMLFLGLSSWNSQPITFADPTLEAAIRERVERPNGPLLRTDVLKVTQLDVSGRSISELSGIQELRRLEVLDVSANSLESLELLADLPRLTALDASGNPLGDLNGTTVRALARTGLRELRLRDIGMSDASLLAELPQLDSLDLRDNALRDITALGGLRRLTHLNLRGNSVQDLSPLGRLTALRYLNIHSNGDARGFGELADLHDLRTLIARGVPIGSEVEAIASLTNLERLNIRETDVRDLTPILRLVEHGALRDIDPRAGSALDIRHNPALRLLNGATLSDLDPKTITRLEALTKEVLPPVFSEPGGFHPEPFALDLSAPNGGDVWFTLDGSEPHPEDNPDRTMLATGPLRIEDGPQRPHTLATTVMGYPERGTLSIGEETPRATVVRARVADGSGLSGITTHTYFVGEDVFARYGVSVVSLATDPIGLFSDTTGLLVPGRVHDDMLVLWQENHADALSWTRPSNFHQRGDVDLSLAGIEPTLGADGLLAIPLPNHGITLPSGYALAVPQVTVEGTEGLDGIHYLHGSSDEDTLVLETGHSGGAFPEGARLSASWERQTSLEFFDADGQHALSQDVGLRVHGSSSRVGAQKSLRLYARGSIGPSRFRAPIFAQEEDAPARLILRRTTQLSGLTDPLGQQLVQTLDSTVVIQRYASAAVFINGEFWGYYGIRDRYDTHLLGGLFGLPESSFAMVRGDGTFRGDPRLAEEFASLRSMISREDMSDPAMYATIADAIDLDNYIDYMVSGIFLNYSDWGAGSHRLTWRVAEPIDHPSGVLDGRWRWVPIDMDQLLVWGRPAEHDMLSEVLAARSYRLGDLLENPGFEKAFLARFREALDGPFAPEATSLVAISLSEQVSSPLLADHARLFGSATDRAYVMENTLDFLRRRGAIVDRHLAASFGERWTRLG